MPVSLLLATSGEKGPPGNRPQWVSLTGHLTVGLTGVTLMMRLRLAELWLSKP